jgi:uncharacterized protein YicC (UPF0701 family)
MTGFARRERQFPWGLLAWELKTVNHRFLEIGCRLPEEFRIAEADFRQAIAAAVRRGKVECSLHFRRPRPSAGALEVDAELLASLTQRAQQIAAQAGARGAHRRPGSVALAGRGARCQTRDSAHDRRRARAARRGAGRARAFRDSEGGRLRDALEQRCAGLIDFAARVAERCRRCARACARSCSTASRSWSATSITTASSRNSPSWRSAWTSTRRSIGCAATCRGAQDLSGQEPAGRRLDFLMQELNREANTLSSKSQDIETTRAAVDMKVLIEQMREQVQNIE